MLYTWNDGVCDIFTWYRPEGYVCKTVPFQIFSSNAKNNSFQLVRTAFPSFFFLFFSKNADFFPKVGGEAIIGFTTRAFQKDATILLAIFFKELLKTISEIYLQGRLTAKAQTVWLDLGPLRSISKFPPSPCQNH